MDKTCPPLLHCPAGSDADACDLQPSAEALPHCHMKTDIGPQYRPILCCAPGFYGNQLQLDSLPPILHHRIVFVFRVWWGFLRRTLYQALRKEEKNWMKYCFCRCLFAASKSWDASAAHPPAPCGTHSPSDRLQQCHDLTQEPVFSFHLLIFTDICTHAAHPCILPRVCLICNRSILLYHSWNIHISHLEFSNL